VNRKTLIIISAAFSTAIIISLSLGLPLYFHYSSISYPPITIVSYELNPEAEEEWTLNVSTILANPCWNMKTPIVEFSKRQDYTVFITVKAKHQRGVLCPQVIVEWNYLFQFSFPLPGNWTVNCNEKTIVIYVQEPCFC